MTYPANNQYECPCARPTRLRRIRGFARGVLSSVIVCSLSLADEPLQGSSPALSTIEQILKQGGATSIELAALEEDLRHASPADIASYEQNLRRQTPAELSKTVKSMGYDVQYVLGPDSLPQPGVPRGKVLEFSLNHSNVFPGAIRKITVYVPAEYTAETPACVFVALDGFFFSFFKVTTTFDNLIYRHEMPVTIAVGIEPGEVQSSAPPNDPRFNRSIEFDGLSDNLARMVLEEVLPEVQRHKTPDGLSIRLSSDPNDRAAGGISTGGIASFTLAWEHPDSFRRVFTASGTFVGMRGGDRYPVLIRKTEPKPIRIFMQDGAHDELDDVLGEMGDWWMGNRAMERALEFSGYQVDHVWGEGPHGSKQGAVVFPDAMRWLWKDWPHPIAVGESQNVFLKTILQPGEGWQTVSGDDPMIHTTALQSKGHRALGTDGRVYWTDSTSGKVRMIRRDGKESVIDSGLKGPTGIALSPDGLWLAVAESKTHWGYSYRVGSDGTVHDKQRFYWFCVPDEADDSGAGTWVMDREGRLYAATRLGIQIFDRNGRVRAILPIPGGEAMDLSFGGEHLEFLYVVAMDGTTYRRRLKVPGVLSGTTSIKLPAWGAG
jgi:gluconolactonase